MNFGSVDSGLGWLWVGCAEETPHRIPAGTPESASPLGEGKSGGFLESLQVRPGRDDSVGLERKTGGSETPPLRRMDGTAARAWLLVSVVRHGPAKDSGPAHHERLWRTATGYPQGGTPTGEDEPAP